ncbi:uncharacterized protein DUF4168 [Alkalispirillum mobile]|uniref:Uncharacterized protein DUF4168 n=1 Tax=Alkalispirillum mobile TaxID=85925 RepID=A0A498C5X8_9GAMM|nr:DUF4168 domain-containing protein [Alkalispirillum mobile]RLK51072.1 uncharacterized protein DUF4168 [Alkalispirillum mobile]
MRVTTRHIPAFLVSLGLALAPAGVAWAANDKDLYESEVASEAELSADEVEDEQLGNFLEAAEAIQNVREDYADQIREAEGEDALALQEEAREAMTTAVEDTGLDVHTYREIGYLLQERSELMDRANAVAAERG